MIACEHLRPLEADLLLAGIKETFRGKAWSDNCREWVYFDCVLHLQHIRRNYHLPEFVIEHVNDDSRSGMEAGLFCSNCKDAIIGIHPFIANKGIVIFNG